jgi:hypothetical protein
VSAKPVLAKETEDCPTDELEQFDNDTLDENEKETVMKLKFRRPASPSILINRNGSRYISPLDIVRSKAGRAEILRQSQSQTQSQTQSGDSQRNGASKPAHDDGDKGSIGKDSR